MEKIPRDKKIVEPPENKELKPKEIEGVVCEWCQFIVPVQAGTCFTCPNCFRQSGGC